MCRLCKNASYPLDKYFKTMARGVTTNAHKHLMDIHSPEVADEKAAAEEVQVVSVPCIGYCF